MADMRRIHDHDVRLLHVLEHLAADARARGRAHARLDQRVAVTLLLLAAHFVLAHPHVLLELHHW